MNVSVSYCNCMLNEKCIMQYVNLESTSDVSYLYIRTKLKKEYELQIMKYRTEICRNNAAEYVIPLQYIDSEAF